VVGLRALHAEVAAVAEELEKLAVLVGVPGLIAEVTEATA
jgi:hypothetical protein